MNDLWLDTDETAQAATSVAAKAVNATALARATRTSTSWADLDNTLDKTLNAASGDIIVVHAVVTLANEAQRAYLDVGTLVSSTWVRFGDTNDGSFFSSSTSTDYECLPFFATRVLNSGDISSGTVTIRWRYKVSASKGIGLATFAVINLGQQAA